MNDFGLENFKGKTLEEVEKENQELKGLGKKSKEISNYSEPTNKISVDRKLIYLGVFLIFAFLFGFLYLISQNYFKSDISCNQNTTCVPPVIPDCNCQATVCGDCNPTFVCNTTYSPIFKTCTNSS